MKYIQLMEKRHSNKYKNKSIEEIFGIVLQQIRKEKGFSQEELGFESGYHRQQQHQNPGLESGYHRTYISLLERGKKSPSLKTIFQLAKSLGAEPSEIIARIQKNLIG